MGSLVDAQDTLRLYDITQYFKHRGLVDEEQTALMSVLGVIQKQNFIIEALSGNGKTFLTNITLSLLPEDRVYTWGLDTDAAAFESAEVMDDIWVIFITELQKFMASGSILKTEMLKDLGEDEGPKTQRRKMGKFTSDGQEMLTQSISGDKAIISTLAVENQNYKGNDVELNRRYPTFSLDTSPEHVKRIVGRQMDLEFKPRRLDLLSEGRIAAVKARVCNALQEDLDIHNPVAKGIEPYIPIVDVQTPSFVNHFRQFMRATTRFYSWRAYRPGDGSLYTTVTDIWELWQVYSDMLWMTVNKVPFLGKRIIKALQKADGTTGGVTTLGDYGMGAQEKRVSMKSIHRELSRMKLPLPYRVLSPLVSKMCDQSFLERHDVSKTERLYSLAEEVQPLDTVKWKQVLKDSMTLIEEVDGKEVAKDWRDHQLDDEGHLYCDHPITGKKTKVF